MKKFFAAMFAALTICLMSACGSAAEQNPAPAEKILVAYFSCNGHTKKAALEVAEILHADTFEIVPEKIYTPADLDYRTENCRANIEQKDSAARPAIAKKSTPRNTRPSSSPFRFGGEQSRALSIPSSRALTRRARRLFPCARPAAATFTPPPKTCAGFAKVPTSLTASGWVTSIATRSRLGWIR